MRVFVVAKCEEHMVRHCVANQRNVLRVDGDIGKWLGRRTFKEKRMSMGSWTCLQFSRVSPRKRWRGLFPKKQRVRSSHLRRNRRMSEKTRTPGFAISSNGR